MSAITPAGGVIPTGNPVTLWTAPNYTCSVSIRILNTSGQPVQLSYYLNGLNRGYAEPIAPNAPPLDVEKGVKLPPGSTFQATAGAANSLQFTITGIQNDGQP